MKSLAQIEPRTPISTLPFTITNSGSYYLTGNLVGTSGQPGIVIQASSVAIDLGGFSISGAQSGISVAGAAQRVVVRNGIVRGCAAAGVDLSGASKCEVESLLVCDNGGLGLSVGAEAMVTRCQAIRNGGAGILADAASSILRCVVRSNSTDGLRISADCFVSENVIDRNGASPTDAGLLVTGDGNRVEANNLSWNIGRGVRVTGSANLIIKNSARNSTVADFDIGPGNNYGQIVYSPGANFVVANAWANFSSTCPSGQSLCNNVCVTQATDPNNCGSCGNVCPPAPNASPSCSGGVCGLVCDPDYGDCNMSTMDGCETGLGTVSNCGGCGIVCQMGWSCTAGICIPPACMPSAEVCNGLDDDCDSMVDEGLGSTSCGTGACARTVQNCVMGQPQNCVPGSVSLETCNNIDDDCDGSVDEDLGSSSCGVGACARTVQNCVMGQPQSCTPGSPNVEVCNGMDDNCNGSTDEGDPGGGAACNTGLPGVCASGTLHCVGSTLVCVQNTSPTSEVCNGQDDNCDGIVDNSATCPVGQSCVSGACVGSPNGTACSSGAQCSSGNCVDGVCCNLACAGTCQACNIAGSVGSCANIPNGADPANECSGTLSCNGAGACQSLLANGAACSSASQCSSGNCVDGVCCNLACASVCQACTAAKKGSGSDGTCGNIAVNTDPDNECSTGAGVCNGSGACN